MTRPLTIEEREALQRFYDGEATDDQARLAETLLNESMAARVFMQALEEITYAIGEAEEHAWTSSDAPAVQRVVDIATQAATLATRPLEELAPMLERFFDGEVVPEEMAAISAIIEQRDDVTDYLAALSEIRSSVRASHDSVAEEVSFDGFWQSVEQRIDAEDATFDPDEHRVLLYRYHDEEVTADERARVETWLGADQADVASTLAALAELRLAATVAAEQAQERVDFANFWHGVEDELDQAVEAQGENVVSLGRERRERKGFLSDSRQGFFVAVAAMLCVAFVAGLFKQELFGSGERVIVEKTVVIVDSVEYQPGSSVMVKSPMQPVSMTSMESAESDDADTAEPTVIWLIEDDTAPAEEQSKDDPHAPSRDDSEEEHEQPI